MKRFLAIAAVVGILTVSASAPLGAQRPPETPVQRATFVLEVKRQVEKDARTNPKKRMLVRFRDGTRAVGRIREARENDFVLEQGGKKPDRTISYSEVISAPQHITPMAEKIAEYTGMSIMIVIFFPSSYLC